jgi:hypothetical protein
VLPKTLERRCTTLAKHAASKGDFFMSDYSLLPDHAFLNLYEEATADSEQQPDSSALDTELSQRATALCAFLDADATRFCRLRHWSIRLSGSPRHRGAVILVGQAFGHPNFPKGTQIATGPVEIILRTTDGDLAITQNGIYELDTVNPDLIEALLHPE